MTRETDPQIRVDTHVHLIGSDEPIHGCWVNPKMKKGLVYRFLRWSLNLPGNLSDLDADLWVVRNLAQSVQTCDQLDAAVLLAMDGVYDQTGRLDQQRTQMYVPNEYLFSVSNAYPFFYPGASVNPNRRDWLDELDRVVEKGAVLIKLIPNYHGIDWMEKKYVPFFRALQKRSIPLLTHGGYEHTLKGYEQSFGDPDRLINALDSGVTVIVGHSGSSGIAHPFREYFWKWANLLPRYPNLYGDLSAFCNVVRKKYLKYFCKDPLLMSCAVQGSDWPVPVHPGLFLRELPANKRNQIKTSRNYFEQDCLLKLSAGIPEEVFWRGAALLNLS